MTTKPRDPAIGNRVVDDLYLHFSALPALAGTMTRRGLLGKVCAGDMPAPSSKARANSARGAGWIMNV